MLALPLVAIGFLMDGHFSVFGNALIFSELFVALTNAIATYLVFKIARFFFSPKTSTFLAFAYAFSTISWPFATFFFQSDTSAMFDVLSIYFAFRISRKEDVGSHFDWLFCGLAIAGGLTIDYVNAVMIPVIGVFLLLSTRTKTHSKLELASRLLLFTAACFEGIVLIGTYNRIAFGNFFTSSEQLYLHSATIFGNFTYPLDLGLVLNLFTPFRGLLVYCPILILGIPGFYLMLESKQNENDGLFLFGIFLALLVPYSAWYGPSGGLSYGPRFVIPSIPFLLIPAGFVFETKRIPHIRALAYSLYAVGAVTNGMAALISALGPAEGPWLSSPFVTSVLPNFLAGFYGHPSIDSWWKNQAGAFWWIIAFSIIFAALALPAIVMKINRAGYDESGSMRYKKTERHCFFPVPAFSCSQFHSYLLRYACSWNFSHRFRLSKLLCYTLVPIKFLL
jgi:hypothetical protein